MGQEALLIDGALPAWKTMTSSHPRDRTALPQLERHRHHDEQLDPGRRERRGAADRPLRLLVEQRMAGALADLDRADGPVGPRRELPRARALATAGGAPAPDRRALAPRARRWTRGRRGSPAWARSARRRGPPGRRPRRCRGPLRRRAQALPQSRRPPPPLSPRAPARPPRSARLAAASRLSSARAPQRAGKCAAVSRGSAGWSRSRGRPAPDASGRRRRRSRPGADRAPGRAPTTRPPPAPRLRGAPPIRRRTDLASIGRRSREAPGRRT
jgi:hypothetical protein